MRPDNRVPIEVTGGSGPRLMADENCETCRGKGGYMDLDPDDGRGAMVRCDCAREVEDDVV